MRSIIPRPLFSDALFMSVRLTQERYLFRHPSVAQYLKDFPPRLNVHGDFRWARAFLAFHRLVPGTFGNYRGGVERLLLWSWIVRNRPVLSLTPRDFEDFLTFNQNPPEHWVADRIRPRFLKIAGSNMSNPEWRPFGVNARKSVGLGGSPDTASCDLSEKSLIALRSVCNVFFKFIHNEGAVTTNPVSAVQPQGFRVRYRASRPQALRLNSRQWAYVLRAAVELADKSEGGERALLILTAVYFMHLKVSELSSDENVPRTMGNFILRDEQWWFVLEYPRKPSRQIRVNPDFLPYLTRYRKSTGLDPLPSVGETTELLRTVHGREGLTSRLIHITVRSVFKRAFLDMTEAGEDALECAQLPSASLSMIREAGARAAAKIHMPAQLAKDLGSVNIGYVYAKYYQGDAQK